ncbi:MAG: ribbon-helix-helix protein, CopG family [Firmicutes bacterium]|uniref:ribbon-helix-helix protein, CopG family n=1 Tax=Lentihominibacter sp. TaxID=2944216 RepID=UPI002A523606|nr:ribbon-helix-helix protein, CopG family [Lentihominibacter sp.]MCI5853053.1 ribbon-helix-helix domain-containing protein [Clostridiales bacterium]MDD7320603.1 ribbon-helix-helix protein, CopG family [Bacillota bacterium]MDY5286150.1 ribbon-helix-helix protein, CopG family [Lentihominibacter sp.]
MKKLIITPKKYTGKTSVVSTRLPDEMIKELEALSARTGKSRNELLVTMIEFALDNIEISDSEA